MKICALLHKHVHQADPAEPVVVAVEHKFIGERTDTDTVLYRHVELKYKRCIIDDVLFYVYLAYTIDTC